ncbi:hypothetical protein HDV05_007235 [Chytridiales sp. JEL 0842]|nr:hypothetical protein HDV05_007235 [Chytridiales sp. JEL 0842]
MAAPQLPGVPALLYPGTPYTADNISQFHGPPTPVDPLPNDQPPMPNPPPANAPLPPPIPQAQIDNSENWLNMFNTVALQQLCTTNNLSSKGTRGDMIGRLLPMVALGGRYPFCYFCGGGSPTLPFFGRWRCTRYRMKCISVDQNGHTMANHYDWQHGGEVRFTFECQGTPKIDVGPNQLKIGFPHQSGARETDRLGIIQCNLKVDMMRARDVITPTFLAPEYLCLWRPVPAHLQRIVGQFDGPLYQANPNKIHLTLYHPLQLLRPNQMLRTTSLKMPGEPSFCVEEIEDFANYMRNSMEEYVSARTMRKAAENLTLPAHGGFTEALQIAVFKFLVRVLKAISNYADKQGKAVRGDVFRLISNNRNIHLSAQKFVSAMEGSQLQWFADECPDANTIMSYEESRQLPQVGKGDTKRGVYMFIAIVNTYIGSSKNLSKRCIKQHLSEKYRDSQKSCKRYKVIATSADPSKLKCVILTTAGSNWTEADTILLETVCVTASRAYTEKMMDECMDAEGFGAEWRERRVLGTNESFPILWMGSKEQCSERGKKGAKVRAEMGLVLESKHLQTEEVKKRAAEGNTRRSEEKNLDKIMKGSVVTMHYNSNQLGCSVLRHQVYVTKEAAGDNLKKRKLALEDFHQTKAIVDIDVAAANNNHYSPVFDGSRVGLHFTMFPGQNGPEVKRLKTRSQIEEAMKGVTPFKVWTRMTQSGVRIQRLVKKITELHDSACIKEVEEMKANMDDDGGDGDDSDDGDENDESDDGDEWGDGEEWSDGDEGGDGDEEMDEQWKLQSMDMDCSDVEERAEDDTELPKKRKRV